MSAAVAQSQEFKSLLLTDIRINGGTQPREIIDDNQVAEYAEAMKAGSDFPAVVVFFDGVTYWLADGFHRTHAARRAEQGTMLAEVHNGTKRDAILYSVGANAAHGLRRTNADKRKAVMTLLEDGEWSQWSNEAIAKQCAVSEGLVRSLRTKRSEESSEPPPPRTYTTKHGTKATMDTSKIGKRPQPLQDPDPADKTQHAREKPSSRGVGLRHAHEAIAALRKIPNNDGLRQEAFDTVSKWIEDNRSNA